MDRSYIWINKNEWTFQNKPPPYPAKVFFEAYGRTSDGDIFLEPEFEEVFLGFLDEIETASKMQ